MARFIFENGIPAGTPGHVFVGWDELDGEATEATLPSKLGLPVPPAIAMTMAKLAPGERRALPSGAAIFREY